ncbi:MAG: hypothetical protein ACRDOH_10500 [Streptosporangiaceae bacterium]
MTDRDQADGEYYRSFVGARMIDRLGRRDADPRTWGIAHRQLVWDWNHDAPAAEHWMQGTLRPRPVRAPPQRQVPRRPHLRPPLTEARPRSVRPKRFIPNDSG